MVNDEGRAPRRTPKHPVLRFAINVTIMVGLFSMFVLGSMLGNARPATAVDSKNKSASTSQGTSNGAVSADTGCEQGEYVLPKGFSLDAMPAGLTVVEDSPQLYTISGSNADEWTRQMQQCSPVDGFAGAASFQLSWQYSYASIDSGLCRVTQPKIGLHLNMVLPELKGVAKNESSWIAFVEKLEEHERGHYILSREYAKTMIDHMNSLQPMPCEQLQTQVDKYLNTMVDELAERQSAYDQHTDHGATQGAVL